ncbi:daunorubicin resistance protein DrrA family ABC transporter ATP-binding protein [Cryptosporangium arvum]|uniref:daunorubicin resistance protein DrrA family ABC transporter ATP-binding protein n=1 Tax=Cryptosporangium arvum TaxID=80871 RepID=UPI0004AD11E1|nr:daunorubicin resistance protein DrrA family ABC transporter ATP-binding protein [Cryptosporangium arvum]
MADVIEVQDLRKSFPGVEAVRGLDLRVAAGELFGLLGPNGAGKTTTLRLLTTLLPIDAGTAVVAGADVARDPRAVRRRIGYVGQIGGADLPATGRENLLLQGRLYGASKTDARRRGDELIEALALGSFVDRRVSTYSGGQRRRLEIALGLAHRPQVLFLDEPTTGLDPQNRANLWDQLRALRADGTTIVLTTHYLEEADALADRLAIVDAGRVVTEGSPRALKSQLAGDTVTLRPRGDVPAVRTLLDAQPFVRDVVLDGDALRLSVPDGPAAVPKLLDVLGGAGVELAALALVEPSLDEVFLRVTGRALRDAA